MERVIYVPSEEDLTEANNLALNTGLPIQVGDSELTSDLSFNRDETQILEIPTVQELIVSRNFFRLGQILRVEYVDEYDSVANVKMRLTHESGVSEEFKGDGYFEDSSVVFKVRPKSIGKYAGDIFDNDGVIGTFSCEVRA